MPLLHQPDERHYRVVTLALALVSLLAPLVVYCVFLEVPIDYERYLEPYVFDLYGAIKAYVVIGCAILAAVAIFAGGMYGTFPATVVMLLMALPLVISTFLSPYPGVVWSGAPYLREGFTVLIAYLALFFAAAATMARPTTWAVVTHTMAASVILVTASAVLESLGILPPPYLIGLGSLELSHASQYLTATLGNANHVGMFAALLGPLFLVLGLHGRSAFYLAVSALALALAVVCKSRLGIGGYLIGGSVGLLYRYARPSRDLG